MKRAMTFIAAVLCAGAFAQPGTPWERRWHPTASGPDEGMAVSSDKFRHYRVKHEAGDTSLRHDFIPRSFSIARNFRWHQTSDTRRSINYGDRPTRQRRQPHMRPRLNKKLRVRSVGLLRNP